jgi:3D (Asp-Asp-Asp) domain-containing protein
LSGLAVLATAYCIHGRTATGTRTRRGTVAVDPAVIPLRRRVFVQGYGPGRSADTGGAIRGRRIDVWYASCAAARRWGVRWVTVTW